MKYGIFSLLFFASFLQFSVYLYAHAPFFDYAKVNSWCSQMDLSTQELQLLKSYLDVGKELSQDCVNDSHFIDTAQGRTLQRKLDEIVGTFMQYPALKNTFIQLVKLIKEELEQNIHEHKNGVKRRYRLMIMIYEACLQCVQKKLQQ